MTPDDRNYLDSLSQAFGARLDAVERELNHVRRNMLSVDEAQTIFRTEVLKVNAYTRLAVALIAGIALVGNGSQLALANHDAASLELRCKKSTTEAIDRFRELQEPRDRALVDSAAMRAVQLRDQQIDTLKGTP